MSNTLIHVTRAVDSPNTPLYSVLKQIPGVTASASKVLLGKAANFELLHAKPNVEKIKDLLMQTIKKDSNARILVHADVASSSAKGVDNHLKTILQAIRELVKERGEQLAGTFNIFLSSAIDNHAPRIINNGNLLPLSVEQLTELEKINPADLVPYRGTENISNGIGYLNALARNASEVLQRMLDTAFGGATKANRVS